MIFLLADSAPMWPNGVNVGSREPSAKDSALLYVSSVSFASISFHYQFDKLSN